MKLTDNIHQLRIDFEIPVSSQSKISRFVNVIIVFGTKITLIDSGVKNSETIIYDYIAQQGRNYKEISTIILSHSHPDHIGAAAAIKRQTKCKVICHKREQSWIENIELQNEMRPVPGFFTLVDSSVAIDRCIEDNESMQLSENISIRCIPTPGHSEGMLSIFFEEDKILFTADAIPLKGDIPNYNNFVELKQSLALIKNQLTYTTLLTSWTQALSNHELILQLFAEAETYLQHLDSVVQKHYNSETATYPDRCKACIAELGLPPFLAMPITDKAFLSH